MVEDGRRTGSMRGWGLVDGWMDGLMDGNELVSMREMDESKENGGSGGC